MEAITLSMQSEVLPDDYQYFLVLDDNVFNGTANPKWNNPWYLAIIGKRGEIIEQSTKGNPSMHSVLFSRCSEPGKLYGVAGTLEECKWWKNSNLNLGLSKQDDKAIVANLKAQAKPNTIASNIPKMVTGPIDNLSEEISVKQSDRKIVNLTQLDRVSAQSQAAINSTKIYRLEKELRSAKILEDEISYGAMSWVRVVPEIEKELKQARELQKLLKKLR